MSDLKFESLGLAEPLLQSVREAGFKGCTPIQAETLPLLLAGRDVAGQAQTGTGKTAAFLLALFHRLLTHPAPASRKKNQPRALVIAPTRELAVQIHKDATVLGAHAGLSMAVVYGGEDYEKQRNRVAEGVDLLIGTPGRLIDYMKQHVFDL
ncbi:MAG TPA: DEAD/DEAH box helicase, partial [Gammaproteobacteria bacterium]|nr:DEAD/DEAH box helicase [Gammaproteobacteria bacterium]